MEAFVGTILPWSVSWAPQDWALCQGQPMQVMQYQALYSLIGNMYGGTPNQTFNLPDLRSRIPLGAGAGPGLSSHTPGQMGGAENAPITLSNLPPHSHPATFTAGGSSTATLQASTQQGDSTTAQGNYLANAYYPGDASGGGAAVLNSYVSPTNAGALQNLSGLSLNGAGGVVTVGNTGAGVPLGTMPPFLVLNYIICVNGLYPMRP